MSALIFMSMSPMAVLATIDLLSADIFGTQPLIERFGRWAYTFIVFGLIYAIHYMILGNRARISRVEQEFQNGSTHDIWGTWLVVGYFVVPCLLLFATAVILGQ